MLNFLGAGVALADRFLADHLTAKTMHSVFGNDNFYVFQKQPNVVVRCLPCQKFFNLGFEREQQRELAREFGLVAAGKLLKAALAVLG